MEEENFVYLFTMLCCNKVTYTASLVFPSGFLQTSVEMLAQTSAHLHLRQWEAGQTTVDTYILLLCKGHPLLTFYEESTSI